MSVMAEHGSRTPARRCRCTIAQLLPGTPHTNHIEADREEQGAHQDSRRPQPSGSSCRTVLLAMRGKKAWACLNLARSFL